MCWWTTASLGDDERVCVVCDDGWSRRDVQRDDVRCKSPLVIVRPQRCDISGLPTSSSMLASRVYQTLPPTLCVTPEEGGGAEAALMGLWHIRENKNGGRYNHSRFNSRFLATCLSLLRLKQDLFLPGWVGSTYQANKGKAINEKKPPAGGLNATCRCLPATHRQANQRATKLERHKPMRIIL